MSLLQADALRIPLADASVHCCVTSPPYWGLRDYGIGGQLGLEPTPDEYVANMVSVFREVWRVLRDDGTLWLNLGDSYAADRGSGSSPLMGAKQKTNVGSHLGKLTVPSGLKAKDLCGIPWRVAFALQADGWYLRSDIIWSKPNPMPESVTDRPTKAHEYLFLLSKSPTYYYDAEAIKEDAVRAGEFNNATEQNPAYAMSRIYQVGATRNRRTVWEIATAPFSGAHFATFPPALVEPCILAGTSARGCCATCGAPWERVTEREVIYPDRKNGRGLNSDRNDGGKACNADRTITTTGWRPTCGHADAATVPAVVLDPFAGSGTTGQVARLHGRRFVGLDINRTYLTDLALPRAEGRSTAASMATLPLFGGLLEPVGADDTPKQDQVGKRQYTGFNERWDAKQAAAAGAGAGG